MDAGKFIEILGSDFFTGVPDSQLKALCDYLMNLYGSDPQHHIIAANEGNCVAIAAGYHLATGKVPVVYMQNSGQGNAVNPIASLLNKEVYGIPVIFVIGWRGEPDVPDEPQHIFQGKITTDLLNVLDIPFFVIDKATGEETLNGKIKEFGTRLRKGNSVAFVVKKGGISSDRPVHYSNKNSLLREEAIRCIIDASRGDLLVSTTGKASRELFELRDQHGQSHETDFLTVGSMGHCSSIALGIAIKKPERRVWCIDGDGAALMHMGALATIGRVKPQNLIHVILNNGAHESVGGMPTTAHDINFSNIARECGYPKTFRAEDREGLISALSAAKSEAGLCLIEVECAIGARKDLGRPNIGAKDTKNNFMKYLIGD